MGVEGVLVTWVGMDEKVIRFVENHREFFGKEFILKSDLGEKV